MDNIYYNKYLKYKKKYLKLKNYNTANLIGGAKKNTKINLLNELHP